MKVFVTGVCGQLGHDVMNELAKRGHEGVGSDITAQYAGAADGSAVVSMSYVQLDITDRDAVQQTITAVHPDAVVHCAAWTAVDLAEDEDKIDKVRAINAAGTKYIAEACKAAGCKMMYISTDYVTLSDYSESGGSTTPGTGGDDALYRAQVTLSTASSTLKLRESGSSSADVLTYMPHGTIVEVLSDSGEVAGYQYQQSDADIYADTEMEYKNTMLLTRQDKVYDGNPVDTSSLTVNKNGSTGMSRMLDTLLPMLKAAATSAP